MKYKKLLQTLSITTSLILQNYEIMKRKMTFTLLTQLSIILILFTVANTSSDDLVKGKKYLI